MKGSTSNVGGAFCALPIGQNIQSKPTSRAAQIWIAKPHLSRHARVGSTHSVCPSTANRFIAALPTLRPILWPGETPDCICMSSEMCCDHAYLAIRMWPVIAFFACCKLRLNFRKKCARPRMLFHRDRQVCSRFRGHAGACDRMAQGPRSPRAG